MPSIAAALLTETETQLTNTVAVLDNRCPAELTARAVRLVSLVERALPEEPGVPEEWAIDRVAEELETSDPAIVPVVG
jgi:hypothetical protein